MGDQHHDHDHEAGCEEALAELYTFLDGELTEERRLTIRRHLDDCTPCLEAFDFEAELRLVIRHRCSEEVPDSLRAKVADQLEQLARLTGEPGSSGAPRRGAGDALAGPDGRS
ncbi:MAG: mycothiol system anti-sigma-R factor [Acidimicrobiales bacterium]